MPLISEWRLLAADSHLRRIMGDSARRVDLNVFEEISAICRFSSNLLDQLCYTG
jgi:hypothetical protein